MSAETFNFRGGPPRQQMRFEVTEGPRAGETINVPLPEPGEPPILIGRSRDCAIWIDAQNISRRNTEILSSPARQPLVRDMGSVNGTQVNGQPISQTQPMPLRPGDHIRVGLTELIFAGLVLPQSGPLPALPISPETVTPMPVSPGVGLSLSSQLTPIGVSLPSQGVRPATLPGAYFSYLIMRDGQRYQLEGDEVTVGRGQTNDIVIDSNSISRQHARLQRTPTGIYVQDLGSTNKTFVNGAQADSPTLLRDGDVVRFGEIEGDFKLEPQRLTQSQRTVTRPPFGPPYDPSTEVTQPDTQSSELTFGGSSQTFVGMPMEQTFIGTDQTFVAGRPRLPNAGAGRRELEQSETALDLDIRIVGRSLRQSASLVPETVIPAPVEGKITTPTETARLEGVFLTEGQGRAQDQLLNNVRLGLKPGELVVLVGPSGSGKTELLQLMAGLRAADRGLISVYGRQFPTMETGGGQRPNLEADRDLARWRFRKVGYLPGTPEFSPKQSALEHVMWVLEQAGFGRDPRERMEKALEQLALVGMTDPETPRLRPADLNRTERKQVALARALALDPPLLLADEPTGGVHSASADRIFSLLKSLTAKGNTVFMVTSDQLWARNADRQIEILDGTIVGSLS